ncbi:MAG: alanine--glyoxylate aminotransferase, partial [Solirubrobacterales bacterium]|nr:alanine--glyoxylate aminotransferase [Solirubrobacterales bacterium]
NRWARQAEAGERLQQRIREMDLELLAEPAHQLAPLTAVRVPDGVDGKAVQAELLERGVEVGGGLGPQAPAIWRLGLMGPNANVDTADRLANAFAEVLETQRTPAAG